MRLTALDNKKLWSFKLSSKIKVGSVLTGGDIIGTCFESTLLKEHRIMIPPKIQGKVISIVEEGDYNIKETILELEKDGKTFSVAMSHQWPVRQSRPVYERLLGNKNFFKIFLFI